MSGTRRHGTAPPLASMLAGSARDIRRALRAADPARPPGLPQLRETGWQLIQLTGELTDLIALLAEHTGHHMPDAEQRHHTGGEPATDQLARACRELSALRHALDTAHTAARDYYTTISRLRPTTAPDPPRRSP